MGVWIKYRIANDIRLYVIAKLSTEGETWHIMCRDQRAWENTGFTYKNDHDLITVDFSKNR